MKWNKKIKLEDSSCCVLINIPSQISHLPHCSQIPVVHVPHCVVERVCVTIIFINVFFFLHIAPSVGLLLVIVYWLALWTMQETLGKWWTCLQLYVFFNNHYICTGYLDYARDTGLVINLSTAVFLNFFYLTNTAIIYSPPSEKNSLFAMIIFVQAAC